MSDHADLTGFSGRRFTSSTGNEARIVLLGAHGIRATWKRKPDERDQSEFLKWMEAEADCELNATVQLSNRNDLAAYREWLNKK